MSLSTIRPLRRHLSQVLSNRTWSSPLLWTLSVPWMINRHFIYHLSNWNLYPKLNFPPSSHFKNWHPPFTSDPWNWNYSWLLLPWQLSARHTNTWFLNIAMIQPLVIITHQFKPPPCPSRLMRVNYYFFFISRKDHGWTLQVIISHIRKSCLFSFKTWF